MSDPLTVRVRAKGDGRLRAMDAAGNLLPRYVGRGGTDLAPLALGEAVPAQREADGSLAPSSPMLRAALFAGDLEIVTTPAEEPVQ